VNTTSEPRAPSPRPAAALVAFSLACSGLLAGCSRGEGASEAAAAPSSGIRPREIPKVRVALVERDEMVQILETTSVLESEREIRIFPRIGGVALELAAEEGDRVRAGDVLARLDDEDQRLAVRDAEVALEEAKNQAEVAKLGVEEAQSQTEKARLAADQAERDFQRNQKLFDGSDTTVLSEQAVETSRLERDNARADALQSEIAWRRAKIEEEAAETSVARAMVALERARVSLAYMRIVAPFDGVVAERMLRVGDTANTAEAAFVLSDIDALRAVFFRPQEELELFGIAREEGMPRLRFHATTEAYPGRSFAGAVERISPTINAESGQFRVTARIEPSTDPRTPLLPGMLVRMRIVTERHEEALVVPKRALQREGERLFLLAVDEVADEEAESEYVIRRIDVDEGFSDSDRSEVVAAEGDDLTTGTLVVVVGSRDLTDGDPVSIDRDPRAAESRAPASTPPAAEADSGAEPEGNSGTSGDATAAEGPREGPGDSDGDTDEEREREG